ncbi:MAG: GNAT family N-acetyltransferase [Bacteroidetes bacterium]|nr:GNAT family N-acetyltransferase [Bacteroidota bacterium]
MDYLQAIDTLISPASESDLPVIELFAKSYDLDCEDLSWKQFIVAKNSDAIIGFGRLKTYPECTEIATVGVLPEERNKGVGLSIVKELIRIAPSEIFVTCVIPNFFHKAGFETVKQYPFVLQKKVDFCKLYDFSDEQIFVMKLQK